jgi:hypothetical protein
MDGGTPTKEEEEKVKSVYLRSWHQSICAKNCKIATGLLNNSRIQAEFK